MPFTPYHLGPALAIGLPLRRYIHTPTFIAANIIVDLEPFLALILKVYHYPLHGYAHTLLGALIIGFTLSLLMYIPRKMLSNIFESSGLVVKDQNIKSYIVAGVSGTSLHILLDSPLYSDIEPLYPIDINPLYNPSITPMVYDICFYLLLLGLIIYLAILLRKLITQQPSSRRPFTP